jgi:mono/diheme cytochrome c family protein
VLPAVRPALIERLDTGEKLLMRLAFSACAAAVLVAAPAFAQSVGDSARGHALAGLLCAECHAVAGTGASPNTEAPSFFRVANTAGISQLSLAAFFQTSHRSMPNFILPAADAGDLIAYILSLKQ